MAKKGLSVKTMKRMLKKAGLKTTGRKAALTRRAKKAHLKMRGGSKSFVLEVVLDDENRQELAKDVIAANSQKIIEWYNENALPELYEEHISNPVMTHLKGNEFRVDYEPEKDPDDGIEIYANPDQNGIYPIEINGTEYLVAGMVKGDAGEAMEAEGGRSRRRKH